jgi:hypothetical protein
MQFECKRCGATFSRNWGVAKCPQCGSQELWTTGGEAQALLRVGGVLLLVVVAVFLCPVQAVLAPVVGDSMAAVIRFGASIGFGVGLLVGAPLVVWAVLSRRKK